MCICWVQFKITKDARYIYYNNLMSIKYYRCRQVHIDWNTRQHQLPVFNLQFEHNSAHTGYICAEMTNLWFSATRKQGPLLPVGKRPCNLQHTDTHTQQNTILYFVLLKTYWNRTCPNLMSETETRLFILQTKLHFKTLCPKFQEWICIKSCR